MDAPRARPDAPIGRPRQATPLLPQGGGLSIGSPPPSERSDAARNRERILAAARRVIERDGIGCLTMDLLATEAGVGKGTIFRRFGSRVGVFQALLDATERDFQSRMISGPPPLGPGADPIERLVAFGRARIRVVSVQGDLLRASEAPPEDRYAVPARQVTELHVMNLLRQAGVTADIPVLAFNLISILEAILILPPGTARGITTERLADGWEELVRALVADTTHPRAG